MGRADGILLAEMEWGICDCWREETTDQIHFMSRNIDSTCEECKPEPSPARSWYMIKNFKYFLARARALSVVKTDVERRMRNNPRPDELEHAIGAYYEMIEPQARDAVFNLVRKGYATSSSGFEDWYPMFQELQGPFVIDEELKKTLEREGVQVEKVGRKWTWLKWREPSTEIGEIKRKWDMLAELFPRRVGVKVLVDTPVAKEFRKKYRRG